MGIEAFITTAANIFCQDAACGHSGDTGILSPSSYAGRYLSYPPVNFKEWRAIAEDRTEWRSRTYSIPMPPSEN